MITLKDVQGGLADLVTDLEADIKSVLMESTDKELTFGEREKQVDELMPAARQEVISLLRKQA